MHYVFADDIFTKGCVCKTNCTGLLTGGGLVTDVILV